MKMHFAELDVVRLHHDLPAHGLAKGSEGTIVLVHGEENDPAAYEVEFCDGEGATLALLTIPRDELADVAHVVFSRHEERDGRGHRLRRGHGRLPSREVARGTGERDLSCQPLFLP